ncbi:MAG: ABC transporter permease [Defluviitaleaceae bacterium]|nr:ABC transporter permease [Defluviitaleaceae bacterium]
MGMNVFLTAVGMGFLWGIMAIGVYITYRVLNIADLTAEGSFTLGAAVAAWFVVLNGGDPFLGTLIAVGAGMIAGFATGFLHTVFKIPPLLSGILSMTALYSVNLRVMRHNANIPIRRGTDTIMSRMAGILGTNERSAVIALSVIFGVALLNLILWYAKADKKRPAVNIGVACAGLALLAGYVGVLLNEQAMARMAVWFPANERIAAIFVGIIFVVIVIFLLKLFFNTEIGYAVRATGDNETMVKAQGVNTNFMKILGLVIGNACVALSGALVFQLQGFADINMGIGTIVIGLASVIIGEVIFSDKRSHRVFNAVVIGSILYRIIIAFVLGRDIHPNDLRLISAVLLAVVLALPMLRAKFNFDWKRLFFGGKTDA